MLFAFACSQSPPKGANIPYRPKPAIPPVLISGGQAFAVQSPFIIPHQQHDVSTLHSKSC